MHPRGRADANSPASQGDATQTRDSVNGRMKHIARWTRAQAMAGSWCQRARPLRQRCSRWGNTARTLN